jgi:hypothetical protein
MIFFVEHDSELGTLEVFVNRNADALGGNVYPGIPESVEEVCDWANEFFGFPFVTTDEFRFVTDVDGEWTPEMITFDADAKAAVAEIVFYTANDHVRRRRNHRR